MTNFLLIIYPLILLILIWYISILREYILTLENNTNELREQNNRLLEKIENKNIKLSILFKNANNETLEYINNLTKIWLIK